MGRGWGRKEEHSFPFHFCATETENPIPRPWSFFILKPHGNACYSGYYNCYELTHCFRLRVFVNNGLPRWPLEVLVRSSCTCNIFLKSKLDILYIYIEKSYIVVTWLYSFFGSHPWFYQKIQLSCRNVHYILTVHQLESLIVCSPITIHCTVYSLPHSCF